METTLVFKCSVTGKVTIIDIQGQVHISNKVIKAVRETIGKNFSQYEEQ